MARVSIFLITVALIAGMVGCGGGGEYDLTIASSAGGSVTIPGEGTFTYDEGKVVNLVATPEADYNFVNWSGDVDTIADVNDASTTITMDSSYSIRANFSGNGVVAEVVEEASGYCTVIAAEMWERAKKLLRGFRDEALMTNAAGRALVDVYYKVSPPIAEFITEHPSLKPIVRVGLLPAVAISTIFVNANPS